MTNYITEYSSIIIVTEKTGGGHEAVANALLETFKSLGKQESAENGKDAKNILVEKYYGFSEAGIIAEKMGNFYNYLLQHHPEWVKWYFRLINFTRIDRVGFFVWKASKVLNRVVKSKKPAVIISVHPLFQEALVAARKKGKLAEMKEVKKGKLNEKDAGKFDIPLLAVITDPFPPFWSSWSCDSMDCYFVPEEETQEEIVRKPKKLLEKIFVRKKSVGKEKVNVTGMCVHPKFFAIRKEDPRSVRKSLGLYPDKFTLFVNAGWNGNDSYIRVLQNLLDSDISEVQVVFLAGQNEALFDRASKLASNNDRAILLPEGGKAPPVKKGKLPTQILGFATYMEKLMRASDLMISKTGAATGYEAFTCGLPIIIDAISCLMPQEQGLAEFIVSKKLGYLLKNPDDISGMIKKCLKNETITNYPEDEIIKNNCSDGSSYLTWTKNVGDIIKCNAAEAVVAQAHNYLRKKDNDKSHKFAIDQSLLESTCSINL